MGQNFRKKYGLDWIGFEIDWIGLDWIKKIGPMSNSELSHVVAMEDTREPREAKWSPWVALRWAAP